MPNQVEKYNKSELLIDIKRKIREGHAQYEITDWVKEHYPLESNGHIVRTIKEADELISRELDFNYRDIMIKHAARYEQIWKKNFTNPFSRVLDNPDEDLEDKDVVKTLWKIRKHYLTAATALKQKQKMLGIVHNRMDVEVKNEFFEQERKNNESDSLDSSHFILSKLTLEEKIEFLHLLKKAKGEVIESTETKVTTTVIVNNSVKEESLKYEGGVVDQFDIEDVEHEEVIEVPKEVYVQRVNENLIEQETKQLEDRLQAQRDIKKKEDFKLAKKKLLEKYKKK
jgi:hypothetical protein